MSVEEWSPKPHPWSPAKVGVVSLGHLRHQVRLKLPKQEPFDQADYHKTRPGFPSSLVSRLVFYQGEFYSIRTRRR